MQTSWTAGTGKGRCGEENDRAMPVKLMQDTGQGPITWCYIGKHVLPGPGDPYREEEPNQDSGFFVQNSRTHIFLWCGT